MNITYAIKRLFKLDFSRAFKQLDKTAKKDITYTYTVRAVNGKYISSYSAKGITVKDKY